MRSRSKRKSEDPKLPWAIFQLQSASCSTSAQGMSFEHAVGGHPDTLLRGLTGATVIKPCLPVEQDFYSTHGPRLGDDFIGTVTPAYYGFLTAQDGQPVPEGEKKASPLSELG